jgi:predicted peptidase
MPRLGLLLPALLVLSGAMRAADFTPRIYTGPTGKTLPYELLIPPGYDKSRTYPLILFFHGAGERGSDNQIQLRFVARDCATADFQAKHPCFVIAPQCPAGEQWVDMPWAATSGVRPAQPSPAMQLALGALAEVTAQFNIDKSRIYATGLSMGGYAVWDCVTRFPDRFAAGVACCGGGDENTVTAAVAKVPVWAFHSDNDPIVPVVRSRNMIAAMKKMGGNPHYTEYQGLGHLIGPKAYSEPELYPWLFQQALPAPANP